MTTKNRMHVVEGLGCVPTKRDVGDESIVPFEKAMIVEDKLHGVHNPEVEAHVADPHSVDQTKVKPQWPTFMGHCTDSGGDTAAVCLDKDE